MRWIAAGVICAISALFISPREVEAAQVTFSDSYEFDVGAIYYTLCCGYLYVTPPEFDSSLGQITGMQVDWTADFYLSGSGSYCEEYEVNDPYCGYWIASQAINFYFAEAEIAFAVGAVCDGFGELENS